MKHLGLAFLFIIIGALGCSSATKEDGKTAATAAAPVKAGDTKAAPAKAAGVSSDKVVCSLGDIKREISIVNRDAQCAVEYTKEGTTNEIASGAAGSNFCKEIQDRVKNNLTTNGYKCE